MGAQGIHGCARKTLVITPAQQACLPTSPALLPRSPAIARGLVCQCSNGLVCHPSWACLVAGHRAGKAAVCRRGAGLLASRVR
eukprot:797854-Pelagomonas_calceolata.AAC.6